MKKCKGCGIALQAHDPNALGYVKAVEHEYCLSCHNLKNYNISLEPVLKSHFPFIEENSLILYVVSALHLNTLPLFDLTKFYPKQKKILVINQIDLLPQTINFDLWVKDLQPYFKDFLEIMPLSGLKGHYLTILLETIDHYHSGNVYLVGLQNSGKTTLLNRISDHIDGHVKALSSPKAGLTQDFIQLPYKNGYIIDSPGVYQRGFISDFLDYDDYKTYIPSKKIRPTTYHLDSSQSIIIGGIVIVSFIKGERSSFTFYLGEINIHRTKYENVYHQFEKHLGTLFNPVSEAPYEKQFIKLDSGEYLINLLDLGFFIAKGPNTLELYAPKGAFIGIRKGVFHGL